MISISDFFENHKECGVGQEWATSHCQTMTDVWNKSRGDLLVWVATRPHVLSGKELQMFVEFCKQQMQHLPIDQQETKRNHSKQNDMAWDIALASAKAASKEAAEGGKKSRSFAWDKIRSAQAEWLRKNITPNFGE
jgi:hypothetical protein